MSKNKNGDFNVVHPCKSAFAAFSLWYLLTEIPSFSISFVLFQAIRIGVSKKLEVRLYFLYKVSVLSNDKRNTCSTGNVIYTAFINAIGAKGETTTVLTQPSLPSQPSAAGLATMATVPSSTG